MTAEQILNEIKALPELEREQLLKRVRQLGADEIPKDFDEALVDFEQKRFVPMVVPHNADASYAVKRPSIDYKARFLKMWGPEAFARGASVTEEFTELRHGRTL